jgi:hypothetical protein
VPDKITKEMNLHLMQPISTEEITRVVFDLGSLKSPGSDGFSGIFLHKN